MAYDINLTELGKIWLRPALVTLMSFIMAMISSGVVVKRKKDWGSRCNG